MVIYREMKLKQLIHVLIAASKMTSIVMFLAAAAMVSGWLITVANIPDMMTGLLEPFMDHPTLLLLVINLLILVIGMVMDVTPMILIFTPVLMPLIYSAGIDPVYFGLIFILNVCIGLLLPPIGTVLNVAAGIGKVNMQGILWGVWPFLLVELIILFLLILFPSLVLVPLGWFT
jgi:TRAP-type transport system large permease protein